MSYATPYIPSHWARAFALVAAGFFIVCVLWGYLLTDPALQKLHMDLLRLLTLDIGGSDMGAIPFIAGLVISGVGAAIVGATLAMCLNHCKKN